MIFWFSGTGNSLWTAQQLAETLNERLVDLARAHTAGQHHYTLRPGETVGWVFPVHAWGPPRLVLDFARELQLEGYTGSTHCWMVATCGDDTGLTHNIMAKALGDVKLNAAFSLTMPNTYVCLPGFDVDPHDLEHRKLMAASQRIDLIGVAIAEHRNVIDMHRGTMPWTKSRVLRPGFLATCMSDKRFKVDTSLCTRCGKCQRECPVSNIETDGNGHPHWQGNCTMCLGCLHKCPVRAIDYGSATRTKGRYHHK